MTLNLHLKEEPDASICVEDDSVNVKKSGTVVAVFPFDPLDLTRASYEQACYFAVSCMERLKEFEQ